MHGVDPMPVPESNAAHWPPAGPTLCRRPTTEQVLRLFSLAQRHRLTRAGETVQVFDVEFTDLQRQILRLLGVSETVYRARF